VRFETVARFFSAGHHVLLPWVAAAQWMLGQSYGAPAAVLAGWSVGAWAFGNWQFARNLRFDAQAAQSAEAADPRSQSARIGERVFRLPGAVLPDPLAAVVEKELRSLARTPRFRTVFMMGFSFGLVVWLPFIIGRGAVRHAEVAENFLVIVSVYALLLLGQVSYWNAFGFDRSAAQVYFALPVPFRQALAGKNIAAALAILLEVSAVTAACLLLHVPIPGAKIVEAYTVTPVAALYMLALGNMSSVNFPRPMNPERVSQGGGATRFQGLLFMLYPLALLPVGLAYLARYAFGSELSFYMVLALAAAVGLAAYWIGMESAVTAAGRRREEIIAELTKGEGPVVGG
jgi:ABC-2 type transport system permease protein